MAAPRQEVITLPLPPSLRQSLVAAGFRTTADLQGVGPVDLSSGTTNSLLEAGNRRLLSHKLSAELNISPDEALLVLKVANIHKDAGLLGESQYRLSHKQP